MNKLLAILFTGLLLAGCAQEEAELPGRTMSDQNPNLVNVGSEKNHRNDIEHARRTILATKEFTPDSIWINGDDLWVTAVTKGPLTGRERLDAQARLHKILVKALPTYHVEVKIEEDRQ